MSSDYIPRLRAELLRAEASRSRHRRPLGRPLALVAAAAVVILALVLIAPGVRDDDRAVVPAGAYRVEPAAAAPGTADNLRARFAAAGLEDVTVTVSGGTLTITAPEAAQAEVQALSQPGRFGIYDWEQSVLGPDGRPAPEDPEVTGGIDAGRAAAITQAEARERGGLAVHDGERWFALGGTPALTNADVEGATAAIDPWADGPTVRVDLTEPGERAFRDLTRELSQRGADLAVDHNFTENQHLALVLDDRLLSVPFINWREAPDGLDGAQGAQIMASSPRDGELIAAILDAGPLPGTLSR